MLELSQLIIASTETTEAVDASVRFSWTEVISPYIGVFYAAFVVAFIMTPVMRKVALKNGIVDWPDMKRKAHKEPVAYLGGIAVFGGWLAGVIVCYFAHPHNADPLDLSASVDFPASIIIGALIITVVGVIDDVYGISPRVKVGGQLFAAALLVVPLTGGEPIGVELVSGFIKAIMSVTPWNPQEWMIWGGLTYWLGAAAVAVLVLGGCNAANLLDGLDGLASGVTGIVAIGYLFISTALAMGLYAGGPYSELNDPVRVVTCLALLGAVLGFLPYNFNPASIFMGDAGSMLLGYLCITNILLFAEKGDTALVMAGLMVFALPILDTTLALVRRKIRGQGLFAPDNQHLHHQLIRSGMTVKQAVIMLYLMALLFAAVGSMLVFLRMRFVAAVFMVVFGFIMVMAYKVGHRQYLASLPDNEADEDSDDASDKPAKEPETAI